MLVVDERISVPLAELHFDFVRSGGPGGQNVNKVATKAVLRWPVLRSPSLPPDVRERFRLRFRRRIAAGGDLILSSDRFRVQHRNVEDCLQKLREMLLEVATPPRPRRPTKPARAARERRLDQKRRLGEKKSRRGRVRPGADD